jgi:hypothetical protein
MKDLTILLDDRPGALAEKGAALGRAGVNIEALYSDHDHRLILVVDDMAAGRKVSDAWMSER